MTKASRARNDVERQKFIEDIVEYVKILIEKRGTMSRSNLDTKAELINFAGFSFVYEGGSLSPTGERMIIWYHPHSEEAQISQQVLSVRWFDITKCDVDVFVKSQKWQHSIKKCMRENLDTTVKHLDAERKRQTALELQRKAERLMIR